MAKGFLGGLVPRLFLPDLKRTDRTRWPDQPQTEGSGAGRWMRLACAEGLVLRDTGGAPATCHTHALLSPPRGKRFVFFKTSLVYNFLHDMFSLSPEKRWNVPSVFRFSYVLVRDTVREKHPYIVALIHAFIG